MQRGIGVLVCGCDTTSTHSSKFHANDLRDECQLIEDISKIMHAHMLRVSIHNGLRSWLKTKIEVHSAKLDEKMEEGGVVIVWAGVSVQLAVDASNEHFIIYSILQQACIYCSEHVTQDHDYIQSIRELEATPRGRSRHIRRISLLYIVFLESTHAKVMSWAISLQHCTSALMKLPFSRST